MNNEVQVYINGTNTRTQYKMRPLGQFRSALLKMAKAKSPITNENAASNGKQVALTSLFRESATLSLEFGIFTDTPEEYYTKYTALQTALFGSSLLTMKVETAYVEVTLYLTYEDMTSLTDYNGKWGSFILRFNEPNPANRTVVISED